jgi:hypothetical protein
MLSSIDPAIVLTIARSMNDNINMDSTIVGSVNDNINMDSTIAGLMNDNINMDSTMRVVISLTGFTLPDFCVCPCQYLDFQRHISWSLFVFDELR